VRLSALFFGGEARNTYASKPVGYGWSLGPPVPADTRFVIRYQPVAIVLFMMVCATGEPASCVSMRLLRRA